MKIQIVSKEDQAYGAFNGGEIVENKPVGFPQEGGKIKPYSNIFYWANAIAKKDSTIGLHPHKGFEIMTFVLEGGIRHFDTKINTWKRLEKGDVQIIRSGNGISHAEHMDEGARMFQIWFDPDLEKTLQQEASYNDYRQEAFPLTETDEFRKIDYVGGTAPIMMDSAGIRISKWNVGPGHIFIPVGKELTWSIYLLNGKLELNGNHIAKDDFVIVSETPGLDILGEAEFFSIECLNNLPYKTYAKSIKFHA